MSTYFINSSKLNNPKPDGNNHICLLAKQGQNKDVNLHPNANLNQETAFQVGTRLSSQAVK